MNYCFNPKLEAATPEFQILQQKYAKYHYSPIYLATGLYYFREKYDRGLEWYPKTPSDYGLFTRFMKHEFNVYRRTDDERKMLATELQNMYNILYQSYSPTVLKWRLDMLVNRFQQVVSNAINSYNGRNPTRQRVIQSFGDKEHNPYVNIMKKVFDDMLIHDANVDWQFEKLKKINPKTASTPEGLEKLRRRAEYRASEASKMVEMKEQFAALVAPRIGEVEGFVVDITGHKVSFTSERDGTTEEGGTQKEDKGEDSDEGTKGDRYSDFRILRLMETLSAKAKRFITNIPVVGVNNSVQFDDLGSAIHVQPRQAAIVLHKLLRHSTSDSMMADLEKAIPRYPWLRKLVEYLRMAPEFQATIFTNFKKANTFYLYMNLVKGKMVGRIANSRSTGNVIAREAGNRMTRGDVLNEKYSVYGSDRLLIPLEKIREMEKELDSWREIPEIAELLELNMYVGGYDDKRNTIKSDIPHNKQRIKELLDAHPEFVERLAGGLQGLGLDIDESEVRQMALQELQKSIGKRTIDRYFYGEKRGLNRVAQLYEGIRDAMEGAEAAAHEAVHFKDKSLQTAQYFYSKFSGSFLYLNSVIALTKYAETEERVINEGKSLTTNNNFNLLHYLIDDLTYRPDSYAHYDETVEQDYKRRLINKFARFEGMSLGYGKQMRLTGWLKWLYENPADRGDMQLVDQCGFNHVEYADMSKAQHIVASIMMYFNKRNYTSSGAKLSHGLSFYEVPIQADYSTAYNFVSAPSYWGVGIGGILGRLERIELENVGKEDVELVEAIKEKYKKLDLALATDRKEDGSLTENPYDSDKRIIIKIDGKVYGTEIVEKLGEEVLIELERIQAIRERKANKDYKLSLGTYDKQGLLFQIFPEFNTNGFEAKYTSFTSEQDAHNFLLEQIAAQLEKVLEQDVKTMDDNNVWSHPAIRKLRMEDGDAYTDTSVGEHTKFSEISGHNQQLFYDFFLNVFYARQQMCKLFTGGMQQFNGLLDYEKRNMLLHAPHGAMYVKATDYRGNPVGQRTQNAVYVDDDIVKSSIYEDADQMLQQLEDDGFITKEQHQKLLANYDNIKSTDGQGFRTFESYRRTMIMMDKWKPEQESAYQTIKSYSEDKVSKEQLRKAVSVLTDGIKPIYTGFEVVPAYPGQKPVRMTVLHKYSETVLLPMFLAEHCISLKSVPMQAFAKVEKAMKERGKSVDLFITHSGVKCGAFSVINPFEKDKVTGERILKSADEIADFMVGQIESTPGAIHTLDLENSYGEAASVSHDPKDERIAMASQAEKVGWADIQEGDTVEVQGRKMDASQARDIFYDIKTADIVSMYQKLREFFVTPRDVDKALKEQLSSKSYVPMDLQFALTHLRLGDFAMPFFAPNVEHQIQELFSSMIKKKLTKPFAAGANILQTTGIGLDFDAHGFDNSTALSDDDKLHVVFEGEGKNKRIKYVEVFLPLTDSRLKLFADEDGKITPARLRELVEDGTIPESMLEFVAYRTPSDAAHSLIPCRVKGFTSPIDGPSIKMPRDIMVMTGHDYDGDKVRCHFKTFKLVEKDAEETEVTDDEAVQMILGQKPVDVNFKKCVVEEYDYSKSSSENSATARANAKVELLFAQLSSPAGSRRVIIPGGSGVTATYSKAHFVMSMLKDAESQEKVMKALVEVMKMSSEEAETLIEDRAKLYKYLTTTAADEISKIANAINGNITPFSFTHEADAFEYMMEYSDMIGIYAMYNSAFQMLQRVDLHYQPTVSLKGNVLEVSLFGHTFDKLFALRDTKGNLASLALARLINAAVDNGKDPLLGYLHQSAKTSELTFFLLASGLSEEQVHLIMNQPIMIELCRRLSEPQAGGFIDEATNLLSEFPDNIEDVKKVSDASRYWGAVKTAGKLREEDLSSMLGVPLSEIKEGEDIDMMVSQCALLNTMIHLYGPATDLSKIVRFTRPESAKGAFGSDIASLIAKKVALDKFRSDVNAKLSKSGNTIFGVNEILKERPVAIGWEDEYFMDIIGDILPEVVSLNSFMLDNGLDMFQSYFPQARRTWLNMIKRIAGLYDYSTINKELISKITNDMLLWKLLSNKNFVQGNPQEVQKDIIVNVPKRLLDIQRRITKAHKNPGTDPAAEKLYGNVFLNKLSVTDPTEDTLPRLIFRMEGAPAEGIRDVISSSWGQLAMSSDEDIRQLAVDLFRYNIYTHGWNYGMYEFAHFAPCNVLWATPGYVKSLQEMLTSGWSDEKDNTNFLHYYIMNHWGDSKLVPSIQSTFVSLKSTTQGLAASSMNPNVIAAILENPYIIINYTRQVNAYGKKIVVPELYRVIGAGEDNGTVIITPAPKLGYRTRRGQMTIQYNPSIDYTEAKPVVTGNDSAWGTLSPLYRKFQIDSNANVEASGQPVTDVETAIHNRLSDFFGVKPSIKEQKKAEDEAAGIVRSDSELDRMAKRADLFAGRTDAAKKAALQNEVGEELVPDKLADSVASFEEAENAEQQSDSTSDSEAEIRKKVEEATRNMFKGMFGHIKIVQKLADGEYGVVTVPATPNNVREARKQRSFVRLNARLREILSKHEIAIGVLDNIEAREGLSGVTVFDRARVTAEGLLELIRISNDQEGERALPEEFAHLALEMLGHDHPLVKRLLAELSKSDKAMQEAYDGMYDEYLKRYGDQREKLILEAAGKLVAKHLFQYQESKESGIRTLIRRVCDAIKSMFRKFRTDEIQNAILDADEIASKIAREMLGGKLADDMSLDNISTTGEYYSIQNTAKKQKTDLSNKHDVLSELHKVEIKRLAILKKRAGRYDENHKPKSISAAEKQVDKLAKAIANNKTEEAIATYINDSLAFLADVEKSLDNVVNSGKPINSVCSKLNVTRDTLYSFAAALDYIQSAIANKEIQDTVGLSENIEKLSAVLNAFNIKYTKLARTYFEEMLSSVYGEHGITKEIGREKGRHISIHEMATKADKDISLMGRWFSAIKDCNDYVLKAIDEIVRDAKVRARLRTNKIRPRIEVAIADLIRETGSRDQSFMFEKKTGADGKLHRTGKYISAEEAKKLSAAQQKFYNTMIAIKKDADACLPASLVDKDGLNMVMVRKYTWDRFVAAEGVGEKALTAWEGLVNRVLDTSDSFDPDYKEVAKDFEGNKVDMLPVKFVYKGASESFDDMTEDVAGSLMAYAGMAYQYNELSGIVNTIENAKYMAGERDVIQKTGNRTERETIQTDDYEFRQPFTRKAARLRVQDALNDFISMHLYGHTAANEGTFGKTRISKRKVVDTLNWVTSLSQMALNLPQRISNVTTGAMQVFIESAGKGVYNAKDISWASAIYMKESADRLAQTGRTDYDNKLSLWDEHFDIHQDNGRHTDNYKKGWLSRVFNSNLLYAGLTIGEDYLSSITSLAVARNFKVKDAKGNETNLWEAYEVKYTDAANKTGAYLALKEGYTKMDGTPITAADELAFSKQVWSLNFDMQGIYNLDDRSAVQQYAFGALIIMYRKWIAPAIKRRYGASQYNMLSRKEEEGYYTTMWHLLCDSFADAKDTVTEEEGAKALLNIFNDAKAMCSALSVNWDKLTPYEKSNMKKALTELSSVLGLFVASALLLRLPPDDHDGDEFLSWLDQLMLSQLLRLRSELGAQAPTPMFVSEGMRILKSPFAAIGPLKSTMNMFQLLLPSNYMTTIKSGRYKGHVRAYKYLREFPVLTMYKKVENFIDPSSTIQYYSTDSGQWDNGN